MPPPSDTYDILIQDSHTPTRLGLGVLLRAQPWVERCHLAPDRPTALSLVRAHRPRVAVVDISTAGAFACHDCEALRRVHTTLEIVLTTRCAAAPGGRATAGGASAAAYLTAEASASEIVDAVRAAAVGEPCGATGPAPGGPSLTPREAEVLQLLATGATNREIAAELHLSTDAIKKYASAVYQKLGVRNRTEAATVAPG